MRKMRHKSEKKKQKNYESFRLPKKMELLKLLRSVNLHFTQAYNEHVKYIYIHYDNVIIENQKKSENHIHSHEPREQEMKMK